MTTSRSEELLVGAMALLVVLPWIAWTVQRGLREGRLPIGRSYVLRDERRGAFNALLGLYAVFALLAVYIAFDLLLGFKLKDAI
ncbi:MAG TPA: hypothetical protein VEZ70_08120 [Allosphingosinicella sp.]|jgi:uncharacterized membrane protein|nr:hypothetical protein [Allosphingosinicella sp.]